MCTRDAPKPFRAARALPAWRAEILEVLRTEEIRILFGLQAYFPQILVLKLTRHSRLNQVSIPMYVVLWKLHDDGGLQSDGPKRILGTRGHGFEVG